MTTRNGAGAQARSRPDLASALALRGTALREGLADAYDAWLAGLLAEPGPGIALVAVGGLGRREVSPGSDLDLVLVHDGARDDVVRVADAVWYPVWDAGLPLDHSVRTVAEAVAVARDDLKAALGLLDARYVAGDRALVGQLVTAVRAAWRDGASRRLPELHEAVRARAREFGEVAFLLEPDLKSARGGLRDVHALQAVAATQRANPPSPDVLAAHHTLLDVRVELHRRTAGVGRRAGDRLLLQEQDAVAEALGHRDADDLMSSVADAGRRIAYAADLTWREVERAAPRRRRAFGRRRPSRRPLAQDVVEQDGEVVLARDAQLDRDAALVLRVAAAAAQAELPISPGTLRRLTASPPLPEPWPGEARDAFVRLLAAGRGAVPVVEQLDQEELLVRLLPEWAEVRSRPQRNSYHRFTVDRHLVETAAEAARLTRTVTRPDLLLLAALFHDIGKGRPGDHSVVGAQLVRAIAPRLGLSPADTDVLACLVEHHLLLPDVATRRDLADPATIRAVADAVPDVEVLELLHALVQADGAATGPAAWSAWKARLVAELVDRTSALLAGSPPPEPAALADWQDELVRDGGPVLAARADEVTVVAPDRPGLLALTAGLLALHRLDVLSAWAGTRGGTAVTVFRVAPRFGELPNWAVVQGDFRLALSGDLPVSARVAAREAAYPRPRALTAPPEVRLVDDASETATVVEVRAPDTLGLLHRVADVLAQCALDVRSAHVSTLGADVLDAFYVTDADGAPLRDRARREAVQQRLLAVLTELPTLPE